MTRLHQHRIARRTAAALSAGVALLAIAAIAPVSANAAVTCDQTISGPNAGVITVAAPDTLCLLNAVQDGAVNVDPGAGLSVISSTITGAVTLNDYSEFEFCDSSTVLVVHPGNPCPYASRVLPVYVHLNGRAVWL